MCPPLADNTIYLDPGVKHRDDTYEKVRNQDLNYVHKKNQYTAFVIPGLAPGIQVIKMQRATRALNCHSRAGGNMVHTVRVATSQIQNIAECGNIDIRFFTKYCTTPSESNFQVPIPAYAGMTILFMLCSVSLSRGEFPFAGEGVSAYAVVVNMSPRGNGYRPTPV